MLAGKLKHDNNPVMNWMIGNLVVKVSKFNKLMQPTKDRDDDKIDGAIAMLMASGRALLLQEEEEARYHRADHDPHLRPHRQSVHQPRAGRLGSLRAERRGIARGIQACTCLRTASRRT